MSGAERLNASTLLDRNLEAGRSDKNALLSAEGPVTYGELASLTAAVASYLVDLGVAREQRVLMILDDSPAFHATFLGAMRIGAVPVPVNPMDRVDNYVYYLDDSYATVLVIEASLLPGLEAELESRVGLHVLVVDGDAGPHASFDAVAREHAGALGPPADTHSEDMAFWLYSSGSTGRPKGVVHAHRNIGVTVDQYARNVLQIDERDICYSTTKLFHAYGLGNGLSFPLSVGAAPDWSRADPHRTGSSRRSAGTGRRCSSRCRLCTRRWSRRAAARTSTSPASARARRRPRRSRRRSCPGGRR